ncbi:MAG TPA: rRNA maturation RNase YbeY [Candidatus Paceibacterota bacterium]
MAEVTLTNETRAKMPRAIFRAIAEHALPADYKLNVVYTNAATMKKYNRMYRDLNKPTDILSFPLSRNQGEIYICPAEARREAPKFDREYSNFVKFLFIHGCVHLKGYDHGVTMENIETDIRRKFKI